MSEHEPETETDILDEDITPSVDQLVSGQLDTESSLLEHLASQRAEESADRSTFILIPGYSGIDVLAKYRLVPGRDLESIARRLQSKGNRNRNLWERNLAAALDTMATACIGLYCQTEKDAEPRPITVGGEPIENYGDPKVLQGFKITAEEAPTTRRVIMKVFKSNDIAVSSHAMKLQRWFQTGNAEEDDDFLGEGI